MSRLMSVSHTTEQVRAEIKTETRRLGWWEDKNGRRLVKPGDTLTLCEKVMGRRQGEPLVRICDVLVTDVRRERLCDITPEAVVAEGFPGWSTDMFIVFFTRTFGVHEATLVTVIQWRYLDKAAGE